MDRDGYPVGMGLFFYPRGGSSQVAGYLSRALAAHGRYVTLACGSLGPDEADTNPYTAFPGLSVVPAAYDDAVARWKLGEDPMDAPFPMHPSFEARAGVPDRAFPWVSPGQGAAMTSAWAKVLGSSRALSRARLLHLHHLTPLHDAATQALPGVPIVTHLHGTELKMLDAIERGDPDISGPHARWWVSRMRAAARRAVTTIVVSPHDADEAERLLGLDPSTIHPLPNGVDVERFAPLGLTLEERRAHLLHWLVDDPRGWDEKTGTPGSVRYTEKNVLDAFCDPADGEARPVLMFVGRFLGFKRVPLLIRAYAQARERMSAPAPLLIWGGKPGEWEGEHPHTVAARLGVDGVFFAGWRGHDELPTGLNCADVFVAPSTNEPFGLVYLEAMACELPVIGTQSGGPPSFVEVDGDEQDGWLVPPDDETALADALVAAVEGDAERARRGQNAGRHVRLRYSWAGAAARLAAFYDEHVDVPISRPPVAPPTGGRRPPDWYSAP